MLDKEYKVKYITSKNSFLFLSDKDYHNSNSQDVLIRLNYGLNKTAYFSLGPPLPSLKEGELALSSLYAKELAILKNDTVSLSSTNRISSVRRLTIIASSSDDYEILELLADTVQSVLLGQVRIVHNGQKLIIWISNSMHVTVMVEGIIPISPGKLENMTEVSIIQANNTTNNSKDQPVKKKSLPKIPTLVNLFSFTPALFRVHPIEILGVKDDLFQQPFNVFLNQQKLPRCFQDIKSTKDVIALGKLHVIAPPQDLNDNEVHEDRIDVFVRLFKLEEFNIDNNSEGIFLNKTLRDILRMPIGSKVILEPIKEIPERKTKSIKIKTNKKLFSTADELVKNYLLYNSQKGIFLINSNVKLSDLSGNKFSLSFEPETPFCLLDLIFLKKCSFIVDDNEVINGEDDKKVVKDLELCLDCSNFNQISDDVRKCVGLKFSERIKDPANILIVGKPGCGKTSLTSYISQELSKSTYQIHTEVINCKKIKGKSVESLLKILNAKFARLIYFQPSLLILDDLHVICEKVVEAEAPTQENLHFNKVSEVLGNFLEDCLQKNCVAILATAESIHKLNQNIFSSRERQIFKNVFSIDDLNKSDRIRLMKYFFNNKNIEYINVDENILGVQTDGFVVQDLIDCIDKIVFESFKETPNQKRIKISSKHCEIAIKQSSSLSMREVQLHSPGDRDFGDVGGLDDVKKLLIECMLWPLQYPNIFGKSPLRLQSGLLLYGPPGTGKTIIAGAAAKHCNLRLISIKGPELLSKYIGASEQAVRDVFLKAQTAKPCILFFDEFDSLAPRRGHDNTGVTDRVVNQFLTQLDGVESLSGVCVLASTSRPDLLDPALLRPGRLDRQILCPLPDKKSRFEILKALSKKINLAKDINLEKLSEESVGFSGADLQSVLCTAQLNSVEHLLNNDKVEITSEKVEITQKHVDEAFKSTKPSLTREEKLKYERIYSKFQSKGDQLDVLQGKQKATLA